jgi:hypothetical protein
VYAEEEVDTVVMQLAEPKCLLHESPTPPWRYDEDFTYEETFTQEPIPPPS